MPFVKVDPIAEARECQEMFKDDHEVVEEFRQFELSHMEAAMVGQEELKLKDKLVEIRKNKNITAHCSDIAE